MKILNALIFMSILTYSNAQMIKESEFILKDSKTNLLWQDTKEGTVIKRDFLEAQNYCQNLELDGYKNWQMPNFLIQHCQKSLNILYLIITGQVKLLDMEQVGKLLL